MQPSSKLPSARSARSPRSRSAHDAGARELGNRAPGRSRTAVCRHGQGWRPGSNLSVPGLRHARRRGPYNLIRSFVEGEGAEESVSYRVHIAVKDKGFSRRPAESSLRPGMTTTSGDHHRKALGHFVSALPGHSRVRRGGARTLRPGPPQACPTGPSESLTGSMTPASTIWRTTSLIPP